MAQESKHQHTDIESWSEGGSNRTYNGNHVKFTGSGWSYGSSYGTILITSGQHEWTIKHTFSYRWSQWIGIASDFTMVNGEFTKKPYAILWCNYYQQIQGNIGNGHQKNLTSLNPVEYWQSGDRITIKLDLTAHTVSFYRNENSKPHAIYTNIPHAKYKVAVKGHGGYGDEFTIISSKSGGISPISNTKCRDCDKSKKAIKALRDENEEQSSEMALESAIINSLKEQNQTLKRKNDALNASNIKLKQQNEDLSAMNNSLNEQITTFTSKMAKLEKEKNDIVQVKEHKIQQIQQKHQNLEARYNIINASNIKLSEDCKDIQSELQEMTVKYNELLRKAKMDESDFENWDTETVYDWIMSIDDGLKIYQDTLCMNMKEEEVDGSQLADLEKQDLHRFGIKSLKYKNLIMKHIKRLTNPQQPLQPSFSQNDEGNNVAPTAFISH